MTSGSGLLILDPADLAACLTPAVAEAAVASALDRMAGALPELPPPLAGRDGFDPCGRLSAGRLAGDPGVAVRSRPPQGPSAGAGPVLWHDAGGEPAALLPDGGLVRDLAAALAVVLALRHTARAEASALAVLGSGAVARRCAVELARDRPLARIALWARDAERAAAAVAAIAHALGPDAPPPVLAPDRRALIAGSDMVVVAAPAPRPLVFAPWVAPGTAVVRAGADADPADAAIDPALVAAARPLIVDAPGARHACAALRQAVAWGRIEADHRVSALGDVAAGRRPGRAGPDAVAVTLLAAGGAVETALAGAAVARAAALGLGRRVPA